MLRAYTVKPASINEPWEDGKRRCQGEFRSGTDWRDGNATEQSAARHEDYIVRSLPALARVVFASDLGNAGVKVSSEVELIGAMEMRRSSPPHVTKTT